MRMHALSAALVVGIAACGGDASEQAPPAAEAPATQPAAAATDWFQVDESARTVTIDIVAGATTANNRWNFNGLHGGQGSITVPEGFTVTINLRNDDPAMGHSVGVGERMSPFPGMFSEVVPIFEGAVTENPTSATESTMPGESESINFVADAAGEYALVCYVIGHAVSGMWVPFNVSADGSHGVTM